MMGKDFENPMGLTNPKGEIRMMSALLDLAVFLESDPHNCRESSGEARKKMNFYLRYASTKKCHDG
jgi:hypothetical protein